MKISVSHLKNALQQQPIVGEKSIMVASLDNIEAATDLREQSHYLMFAIKTFRLNLCIYDYLNRKFAVKALESVPAIPPIHQVFFGLIDAAIALRASELSELPTDTLEKLLQVALSAPQTFKGDRSELIAHILPLYRVELITGVAPVTETYKWWLGSRHFHLYPNEAYFEHKMIFDLLDIDLIIRGLHFSTLPLATAINYACSRQQEQPTHLIADADEAFLYDANIGVAHTMHPSRPWTTHAINVKQLCSAIPVVLSARAVRDSHVIFIRDNFNRYWVLHVAPASTTNGAANGLFYTPAKPVYQDLLQNSNVPGLGLLPGSSIQVLVFDSGNHFDQEKFNDAIPESVDIEIIHVVPPLMNMRGPYSVSYVVEENKFMAQSANLEAQIGSINGAFQLEQPPEYTSASASPGL